MRIGVDIMGGDFYPQAPIEGAILAQNELGDEVQVVLIGDEKIIHAELEKNDVPKTAFEIVHTAEAVEMGESPTKAISQKPRATINVGVGMVKAKQLNGFVSAGNTGAMLVASIMGMGRVGGVSRPTIGVLIPSGEDRLSLLCDVGANLDSKPEALYHFGILGSVFMENVL
ncbi:MAG: phosphate--acyl-ACP acyltransferase, partial [Bacteroidota bacterium]